MPRCVPLPPDIVLCVAHMTCHIPSLPVQSQSDDAEGEATPNLSLSTYKAFLMALKRLTREEVQDGDRVEFQYLECKIPYCSSIVNSICARVSRFAMGCFQAQFQHLSILPAVGSGKSLTQDNQSMFYNPEVLALCSKAEIDGYQLYTYVVFQLRQIGITGEIPIYIILQLINNNFEQLNAVRKDLNLIRFVCGEVLQEDFLEVLGNVFLIFSLGEGTHFRHLEELHRHAETIREIMLAQANKYKTVTILDISGLNLNLIPGEVIKLFPNVIQLDVSYNKLCSLDAPLDGFPRLESIDVSYNPLPLIPQVFVTHPTLKRITHSASLTIPENDLAMLKLKAVELRLHVDDLTGS